ncbi:MAG: DNA gyrase modulator, partial [Pseudomonadota bacterium]
MSYDRDRDSSFLEDLISRAKKAGADAADAVMFDSTSLSVGQRLGKPETIERAESSEVGLRVFIDKQMAIVSSGERDGASINKVVEQAIAMAKAVPADPYAGIADPSQ